MLLRREDAHPSRRFFCGSAFDGSAEPLQSFVYAIPGKIAARFAWENRFTLFLELPRSFVCAIPGKTASRFA
jgi:hypothetical protein